MAGRGVSDRLSTRRSGVSDWDGNRLRCTSVDRMWPYVTVYDHMWLFVTPVCDARLWRPSVMPVCDARLWCPSVTPVCDARLWCPSVTPVCDARLWRRSVTPVCDAPLWRPFVTPVCDAHLWRPFVTPVCAGRPYSAAAGDGTLAADRDGRPAGAVWPPEGVRDGARLRAGPRPGGAHGGGAGDARPADDTQHEVLHTGTRRNARVVLLACILLLKKCC